MEGKVLVESPVRVVVGLLEDVPHEVLLVVLLLDQPHVQLHLSEKVALPTLLPAALILALARRPLQQNQLGAVQVQPRRHLLVPDLQNVSTFRANLRYRPVNVLGLDSHHLLQYLN